MNGDGNGRAKLIAVPAFVVVAIIASLHTNEGRKYVPYYDKPGHQWTVCAGITGPEVVPGRTYTDAECDTMENNYVQRMLTNMGHCVTVALPFNEIRAWGDFAYNVGTTNFCKSSAATWLNTGQNKRACNSIPQWKYVGGKDCNIRANKCHGVIDRRLWEQSLCMG